PGDARSSRAAGAPGLTAGSPAPGGPVLVTGATGFLGRAIVRALVDRGTETHAFAREGSPRGPLAGLAVAWHAGDLRDAGSVDRAVGTVAARAKLAGAPARIVHAAALISYRSRDGEEAREVNVRGTERLLEAAAKHGIGRFVQVSSVVTVGACPGERPID